MKRIVFGEKDNPVKLKNTRKVFKKIIPVVLILSFLTAAVLFITSSSSSSSLISPVVKFIFAKTSLDYNDDRVNVLLLGMAGGRHDGATLTDTILVASYNLNTNQLHIISIPRDLWLPSLASKANAVYQAGLSQKNGLAHTKVVIGNVVGLPIHYGLRIDFQGFIDAVNILGGIDIEVQNSFDDYLYPITGKENDLCGWEEVEKEFNEEEAKKLNIEQGKRKVFVKDAAIATDSAEEDKGVKYFSCRFEHINFDKGLTHMDGEEALKFVRSRHGTNGEGSDFARSKRQEFILQAIRKKVLSLDTLFNPKKLGELFNAFSKSIDTDISIKDALEFYKLSKKLTESYPISLDDSVKEGLADGRTRLLTHPSAADFGGAYVLVSEDDDFSIIHKYIMGVLRKSEEEYEASTAARTGSE
ncbi:hypothetical protein A3B45_02340 [Candidatus Daviesbacteria bacterium RIFCSPLOWO2_01_FULL_39_12]|uniref:Cell envelope-related transcriptional attenuator domain-containing protein n=1 Tax=Candidatus Daviesbacteria bacterium RIFCSPLOWO2_01_FULL_39_12 TaxID=1797785 RepID=A0A1F5KSE9_9BACT|nr:MAG: hypothetical protein A3D79_00750 [Candidatus Daviesbacteria bacterium RIFCSPHIGHO2_02_FULL_39_8]OGE43846.1 MAG: hypothetical protein A3B45_02340 [Candidatus Daviesbacteria bacterium RIFCSPLOWO2_01_FULL_39_12]